MSISRQLVEQQICPHILELYLILQMWRIFQHDIKQFSFFQLNLYANFEVENAIHVCYEEKK